MNIFYTGCTLSSSAFGEILEWELLKTRLCECNFVHSCCELSIHPGMQIEKKLSKIRDGSLMRHKTLWLGHRELLKSESWRDEICAPETIREHLRQGECFHLHSRSRLVSGSVGESVQLALEGSYTNTTCNMRYCKKISLCNTAHKKQ